MNMRARQDEAGYRQRGSRFSFAVTLRDRITHELYERILLGEIKRGERLDLDRLAEEFGSSRTPVREALIQLSHDGLVNLSPRRSVVVLGLSPEAVRDNYFMLGELSGLAAELCTRQMTPEVMAHLRELNEDVIRAKAAGGSDLVAANWNFHRGIHRSAGSERLLSMLHQLARLVPTTYLELIPERIEVSVPEHEALLALMAEGDHSAARTLACEHVRNAGDVMVERLGSMGVWDPVETVPKSRRQ